MFCMYVVWDENLFQMTMVCQQFDPSDPLTIVGHKNIEVGGLVQTQLNPKQVILQVSSLRGKIKQKVILLYGSWNKAYRFSPSS